MLNSKLLVLADGPCTFESFRPSEDAKQWWGRRDALVRIIFAQSQFQREWDESAFILFHNGTEESTHPRDMVPPSILTIAARESVQLSENAIISAMKSAAKHAQRSGLARSVAESSKEVNCRFLDVFPSSRMISSKPPTHNMNVESMGKKDLVKLLHDSCPIDHLRKHQLNGSVEAILKKRNVQQLQEAWEDWKSIDDVQSQQSTTVRSSEERFEELISCYVSVLRRCVQQPTVKTSAVFGAKKAETPSASTQNDFSNQVTILLLHEDYEHELPVFGFPLNTHYMTSQQCSHTVLCVMGAVRDMTTLESRALVTAAQRMRVPIATANLGRTAEFTSKIVMALRGHMFFGHRLYSAVQHLLVLQAKSTKETSNACGAETGNDSSSLGLLQKNTSIRPDGVTWDGYHTNSNKQRASADHVKRDSNQTTLSTSPQQQPQKQQQQLAVMASLDFPLSTLLDISLSSAGNRALLLPLVRLVVNTLWKSRLVSDVLATTSNKSHGNHSVPTLKNQEIDENGTLRDFPSQQPQQQPQSSQLENRLYLSFSCGATACLTPEIIASEVSRHHTPAPSEYNVLMMLRRLLLRLSSVDGNQADESTSNVYDTTALLELDGNAKENTEERLLQRVYCDALRSFIAASSEEGVHSHKVFTVQVRSESEQDSVALELDQLADHAYGSPCNCNGAIASHSSSNMGQSNGLLVLCLSNRDKTNTKDATSRVMSRDRSQHVFRAALDTMQRTSTPQQIKHRTCVLSTGRCPVFTGSKVNSNSSQSSDTNGKTSQANISDAFLVCMLQHWAYHGRLFPALEVCCSDMKRSSSIDMRVITEGEDEEADVGKKKKDKKHRKEKKEERKKRKREDDTEDNHGEDGQRQKHIKF